MNLLGISLVISSFKERVFYANHCVISIFLFFFFANFLIIIWDLLKFECVWIIGFELLDLDSSKDQRF